MKIGDEVFVHGYVDEIRKDCVIIRNDGGYFGTAEDEIVNVEIKAWHKDYIEPKVTIEDTPQTECEACELDGKADVCKICRVSNYEPQTDCGWK